MFYFSDKTVQTQTGLITNVTIECFTHILNGEHAAEFSRVFDTLLRESGRLKINSNTLFGKFLMERTMFLFSGAFFPFKSLMFSQTS